MSKPMLVTLPFVLLLLDYWPLQRLQPLAFSLQPSPLRPLQRLQPSAFSLQPSPLRRLLCEKLPFLLLSLAMTVVTFQTQKAAEAMSALDVLPLPVRLVNAATSYVKYIGKMIWPDALSVFYPYPASFPAWKTIAAVVLLLALSVWAVSQHRRRPYLMVGWLWYGVTLLPVIGLVQVGTQAMADRYTYIPLVGLFLAIAWGAHDLLWARGRGSRFLLAVLSAAALVGCGLAAHRQVGWWKNSETLFTRALAVTDSNYVGHLNLGNALGVAGRFSEALPHLQEAVRLRPNLARAHNNLANALAGTGRTAEARAHYLETIRLQPDHCGARNNLGILLAQEGKLDEAIAQYQAALQLKPDFAEAHHNWGEALLKQGKYEAAMGHLDRALQAGADPVTCHQNLAMAFSSLGRKEDALRHYREVVRLAPGNAAALVDLAWILATGSDPRLRDGAEAIRLAEHAVALTKNSDPRALDTLGAAYAEGARFAEAAHAAQRALDLAQAAGQAKLAREIQAHLQSYRDRQPVRDNQTATLR